MNKLSKLRSPTARDPLVGLTIALVEVYVDPQNRITDFVLSMTNGQRFSVEAETIGGFLTVGEET